MLFYIVYLCLCTIQWSHATPIPDSWYPHLGQTTTVKKTSSCTKKCAVKGASSMKEDIVSDEGETPPSQDTDATIHNADPPHQSTQPCFIDTRPSKKTTLTEDNDTVYKECQKQLHYECKDHLCPTYCKGRYTPDKGEHRHDWNGSKIDPLLEECLSSCKKKCAMPIDLDQFDQALHDQLNGQMTQCIRKTRQYKTPCERKNHAHEWRSHRESDFQALEKSVQQLKDGKDVEDMIDDALHDS